MIDIARLRTLAAHWSASGIRAVPIDVTANALAEAVPALLELIGALIDVARHEGAHTINVGGEWVDLDQLAAAIAREDDESTVS